MNGNKSLHENAYIDVIKPQLVDDATVASAWLPLMNNNRTCFIVNIGATDTTVDAKVQQATAVAGTNAKDVTGAAITQVSATGDNKYMVIDLETDHLDVMNGFNHVQLQITAGNGDTGAQVSAVILRHAPRHVPVTQSADLTQKIIVAG